jgi:hypothetical protein
MNREVHVRCWESVGLRCPALLAYFVGNLYVAQRARMASRGESLANPRCSSWTRKTISGVTGGMFDRLRRSVAPHTVFSVETCEKASDRVLIRLFSAFRDSLRPIFEGWLRKVLGAPYSLGRPAKTVSGTSVRARNGSRSQCPRW